ncbi:hypothetical protein TELCIR_08590 [Teladorsagia circumcincta]|uniref:RNA-directed DNA polymerase n=1 Tax=Teladorsagia circumcincta TaxID=45464 RepID=A0A2G9UH50_TELCI|nr:hypothetical protein TELCIR_08590 [Teladorsagia circumcincta]
MSDGWRKGCNPERIASHVLKELHIDHPEIVRKEKLAQTYEYWPNIDERCENLVRSCSKCREYAKISINVLLETCKLLPVPGIGFDFAEPMFCCYYMDLSSLHLAYSSQMGNLRCEVAAKTGSTEM